MKKEQKKEAAKKVKSAKADFSGYKKPVIVIGSLVVLAIGVVLWAAMYSRDNKDAFLLPVMDKGVVVAKVGGDSIKLEELEAVKASVPQLKDIPLEVVYNQLLEAYINNKIILDEAKKAGLQNKAEVKKMLKDAEDQILFQAYLAEQLKKRMTPEKLQALYQQEVKNYKPQEEVHARHILVKTEKEAKDLIVQLKAGAKFEDLANKYSLDKDPNGTSGGDLGYFTKPMMIQEFANAAFEMKKGSFSQKPVKTPFGWHVIKIEDKRMAPVPPYSEVEEAVKARFTEIMVPQIIEEERRKANVEVFNIFAANNPVVVPEPKTDVTVDVEQEEAIEDLIPAVAADTAETEAAAVGK